MGLKYEPASEPLHIPVKLLSVHEVRCRAKREQHEKISGLLHEIHGLDFLICAIFVRQRLFLHARSHRTPD